MVKRMYLVTLPRHRRKNEKSLTSNTMAENVRAEPVHRRGTFGGNPTLLCFKPLIRLQIVAKLESNPGSQILAFYQTLTR